MISLINNPSDFTVLILALMTIKIVLMSVNGLLIFDSKDIDRAGTVPAGFLGGGKPCEVVSEERKRWRSAILKKGEKSPKPGLNL